MTSEHTPLLHGSNPDPPHPSTTTVDDNLTKFRKAIGINIDETGQQDVESARKGARGLYAQIIRMQRSKSRQYHFVDWLYYLAIGANIIISATLASLGPLSKLHPTSITILGVVNTSTGGVLALLKGQGLPDRLQKDEYQLRKVQDFIEETDIRLAVMPKDMFTTEELDQVVQQVFEKYNTARDTSEMNRPASYAHQAEDAVERRVSPGDVDGVDGAADVENPNVGRNKPTLNPDANGKGKTKFVID
jgi:hypothetical protein